MIETKSEAEVSNASAAVQVLPVSVIVPVRNEAHNLRRCLESLKSVGEIYVVDSQSSDDTAALRSRTARRLSSSTMPEAGRKNASGRWTRCPWLTTGSLLLDADEVLTPELAEEIRQAMQNPRSDGYYIALQMYFLGRRSCATASELLEALAVSQRARPF